MLGKIATVCVLVLVSACLVRQQPGSEAKFARVSDDIATLFSKWGAKSADDMVAKFWAKTNKSDADFEDLHKLLTSSNALEAIVAFKKPVNDMVAKLDKSYDEYDKLPAGAPKRISDLAYTSLENNAKELNKLSDDYALSLERLRQVHVSTHADNSNSFYRELQINYRALKALRTVSQLATRASQQSGPFVYFAEVFGDPIFKLIGTMDDVIRAHVFFGNYYNLHKFIKEDVTPAMLKYSADYKRLYSDIAEEDTFSTTARIEIYREFMRLDRPSNDFDASRNLFKCIRDNIEHIDPVHETGLYMGANGIAQSYRATSEGMRKMLHNAKLLANLLYEGIGQQIELFNQLGLSTARQAKLQAEALQGSINHHSGTNDFLDGKTSISAWVDDTKEFLVQRFNRHNSSITSDSDVKSALDDVLFALDELKKVSM